MSTRRPPPHASAGSLADSGDEVHIMCFPLGSALILCDSGKEVLVPRMLLLWLLSCLSSTSRPFV
jgi:hypothetical protein